MFGFQNLTSISPITLTIMEFLSLQDMIHLRLSHKIQILKEDIAFVLEKRSKLTGRELCYLQSSHPTFSSEKVKELDLSCSDRDDAEIQRIAQKFPQLQALDLAGCSRISDVALQHLTRLRELDLTGCHLITNRGLRCLTSLQKLNLTGCFGIADQGLRRLKDAPLQSLDLTECDKITDRGLRHLKNLPLCSLSFNGCFRITDKGLQHLKNLPLRILRLASCTRITDAGLQYLENTTSLQELNLAWCHRITDAGLRSLKPLHRLEKLDFAGCIHTSCQGISSLSLFQLKALNLARIAVRKFSSSAFPRLRELVLAECGATDATLQLLPHVSLEALSLAECHAITDAGMRHLAKCSHLQKLNLVGCRKITDIGLKYLTNIPNLQILGLVACRQLTDTSLVWLARFQNLQKLDLMGCPQITSIGLQHLTNSPSLQVLSLPECVSESDLILLARRWPNVKRFYVGAREIPTHSLRNLRARQRIWIQVRDFAKRHQRVCFVAAVAIGYFAIVVAIRQAVF